MEKPVSHTGSSVSKSLDLCGLRCPHLLISVIEAIRALKPGQELQIRANDLNAPSSITAWLRQSGNELLDMYQEGECFVFLLKRNHIEVEAFKSMPETQVQKEEGGTLTADR